MIFFSFAIFLFYIFLSTILISKAWHLFHQLPETSQFLQTYFDRYKLPHTSGIFTTPKLNYIHILLNLFGHFTPGTTLKFYQHKIKFIFSMGPYMVKMQTSVLRLVLNIKKWQ